MKTETKPIDAYTEIEIVGEDGKYIGASIGSTREAAEANAKRIVTALRSHQVLVDALEEVERGHDAMRSNYYKLPKEMYAQIRAALKLAKGESQ